MLSKLHPDIRDAIYMTMTSYIVGYLGIGTRHFIRAQSDEAQGGIDH